VAKTNEWDLLKYQFDALVHESAGAESIDEIFDDQFRRRFFELINQTAQRNAQMFITGPAAKTPTEYKGQMAAIGT
jgi:hypothetical protein